MRCESCGREMHMVSNTFGGEIYHCGFCGLYSAAHVHYKKGSESTAEDTLLEGVHALRYKNYKIMIADIRENFIKRKESIVGLDVGCAKGWFIDAARDVGIEMEGIESSGPFYSQTREKGYSVVHGFFPQDFRSDRLFDFIVFNDVLEHIPDLEGTIRSCYRYLKPDGLLIINCPTSQGIFFRVAQTLAKFGISRYARRLWQFDFYSPHLWYFNGENLNMVMKKYGFEFESKCRLSSIDQEGLKKRILYTGNLGIMQYMTYYFLRITLPIWNQFPSDIMCMFYRKVNES